MGLSYQMYGTPGSMTLSSLCTILMWRRSGKCPSHLSQSAALPPSNAPLLIWIMSLMSTELFSNNSFSFMNEQYTSKNVEFYIWIVYGKISTYIDIAHTWVRKMKRVEKFNNSIWKLRTSISKHANFHRHSRGNLYP